MNAPRSIFGSLGTSLFGSVAAPATPPANPKTAPPPTTKLPATQSRTLPAQPGTGANKDRSTVPIPSGTVNQTAKVGLTSETVSHML